MEGRYDVLCSYTHNGHRWLVATAFRTLTPRTQRQAFGLTVYIANGFADITRFAYLTDLDVCVLTPHARTFFMPVVYEYDAGRVVSPPCNTVPHFLRYLRVLQPCLPCTARRRYCIAFGVVTYARGGGTTLHRRSWFTARGSAQHGERAAAVHCHRTCNGWLNSWR